jgi:hypothetical protein
MSMHLVGSYMTTTRYNSKNKKSKSAKLAEATAKHEKWLRDRGLHPEQRTLQRAFKGRHQNDLPDYTVGGNLVQLSNSVGNGYVKGIMANLHKESPAVQKEILDKASRTAPAYSKGAYQYITPGQDLTDIGKKK